MSRRLVEKTVWFMTGGHGSESESDLESEGCPMSGFKMSDSLHNQLEAQNLVLSSFFFTILNLALVLVGRNDGAFNLSLLSKSKQRKENATHHGNINLVFLVEGNSIVNFLFFFSYVLCCF
eukprot:UN01263